MYIKNIYSTKSPTSERKEKALELNLPQTPDNTLIVQLVVHQTRHQSELLVLNITSQILSCNTRDLDKAAGLTCNTDEDTSTT
jgi:hypothetical protein